MLKLFLKKEKWEDSCQELLKNQISEHDFVIKHADRKVFYSTPFGEDKNVKPQLWILSGTGSNIGYYPVFSSSKRCNSFFNSIGRADFLIIEGDINSALEGLDSHEILTQLA